MTDLPAALAEAEAFERLQNAALPGPYLAAKEPRGCSVPAWVQNDTDDIAALYNGAGMPEAELFAAARNTTLPQRVKELVAEIERLRGLVGLGNEALRSVAKAMGSTLEDRIGHSMKGDA